MRPPEYEGKFMWRLGISMLFLLISPISWALTANKVWFENRDNGRYRVHVQYTVPAFKEFREAYVEFQNRQKAEEYFWNLVRGADFYKPDPDSLRFKKAPLKPDPW